MTRFTHKLALIVVMSLALSACGQYSISNLRAMKAFKEANELYKRSDFKAAAERYEAVYQYNPDFFGIGYFFLGNSYDQLYKPSRKGEPENDAYLQKAVQYYKLATEKIKDTDPDGPTIRERAFDYLIAAYGSDRLADMSQAEPVAKQLIALEPNEPSNYQLLGKLYEDAGRYDEAEAMFEKAIQVKPNDPAGYQMLAGYYNRQGQFDKTMDAFQKRADLEPNNPEAWHTMATYLQEKAWKDHTLPAAKAKEYIDRGIAADDKAIGLNPEYYEALTYKQILLRMKANYEKNPAAQKALIDEADKIKARANEVQKKQSAGRKGGN